MIRASLAAAFASAIAINLAGCDRAPPVAAPSESAAPVVPALASPPADLAAPSPEPTPTAEISTPGVPSASRDPGEVLAAWAKAVEMRDWATVRAYWGDKGARSGLSDKDFAAKWSSLLDPRVTIGKGEQEGAAGSLYYTAPVRIIDGPRTVRGQIVLRRANDVDGATDEQLRWHIESTTLEP
ncbi:hypothetical protein OLX02_04345 [Novosphingobium sp. KCTC 2891]|nr:hypothetical protein [Novosphingobium sp. KCTC 2891]